MSSFIISIHPCYVSAILAGAKTVECRKSTIGLAAGAHVFLYATAPVKAIQGEARITQVLTGSPQQLWTEHREKTCVTEEDFFAYYRDAKQAVLLALEEVVTFRQPVALATLRELQPGFSPPQTARRLGPAFDHLHALVRDLAAA
jgi:predicted transcriptional regulator